MKEVFEDIKWVIIIWKRKDKGQHLRKEKRGKHRSPKHYTLFH